MVADSEGTGESQLLQSEKEVKSMYAKLVSPGGNWDPGIPCLSWGGAPVDAPCSSGNTPKWIDCALLGNSPN